MKARKKRVVIDGVEYEPRSAVQEALDRLKTSIDKHAEASEGFTQEIHDSVRPAKGESHDSAA